MPADRHAAGVFRVPGCYAALIDYQQKAIVSIDLRLLDWDLTDPHARAADRAALEYETRLNRQPSALLTKLLDNLPVVVDWRALPHLADPPEWLSDPRTTPYVRVWPDDFLAPADGPPDQHAQQMG